MPYYTFTVDERCTVMRRVCADNLEEAESKHRARNFTIIGRGELAEELRLVTDEHGRKRKHYFGRDAYQREELDLLLMTCQSFLQWVLQISSPSDSLGREASDLLMHIAVIRARYGRDVEPTREDWIAIAEAHLYVIEYLESGSVVIDEPMKRHLQNSKIAVDRALLMARNNEVPVPDRLSLIVEGSVVRKSFVPEEKPVLDNTHW
jgi:hypothetical protein